MFQTGTKRSQLRYGIRTVWHGARKELMERYASPGGIELDTWILGYAVRARTGASLRSIDEWISPITNMHITNTAGQIASTAKM